MINKAKGISLPTTLFSLVAIGIAATVLIKYTDTSSAVTSAISDKANATSINECVSNYIALDYFKRIVGTDPLQSKTNSLMPSEIEFYRPNIEELLVLDMPSSSAWTNSTAYTSSSDKYGAISACVPKDQEVAVKFKMYRMCKCEGDTSGSCTNGKPNEMQECQQIAGIGTGTGSSSLGYNSYNYITNTVTNAVIYKLYTQVITNPVASGRDFVAGKKSAVSTGETVFSY